MALKTSELLGNLINLKVFYDYLKIASDTNVRRCAEWIIKLKAD